MDDLNCRNVLIHQIDLQELLNTQRVGERGRVAMLYGLRYMVSFSR